MFLQLKPLFSLLAVILTLYLSLSATHQAVPPPVAWLTIPAIELSEPVYPVEIINKGSYLTWPVLDDNVAWHNLSALPGQGSNIVLNGHSTLKGQVFQNLHLLKEEEPIKLIVGDQTHTYWVKQRFLVQEEGVSFEQRRLNGRWIMPTEDERITIVTCAEGTKYRLIVIAFP